MSQLKTELNALLLKAQRHPAGSASRQRYFSRFYHKLLRSPDLLRPHKSKVAPAYYDEVYETTLQDIGVYLFRKLDSYDPARGDVIGWVNYLLNVRFYDALKLVHPKYSHKKFAIQYTVLLEYYADRLPNDDLQDQELYRELLDFIKTDPNGTLQQSHIQGKPAINFKTLLLKRLENYAWQELAEEFATPIPTLSSFYRRSLKKFVPLFQQSLCPQI
ncbi:MAG: hypothetical protein AAGG51_26965 [Cyanobacteria bacterium P01_G01_bin.54]